MFKKCIHHSNNTRYSQLLIIAQTSKALDLLLKQSPLDIVVFYTQKTSKRGKHTWDQGIVSLEASLAKTAPTKSAGTKDSVQFKCYFKMIWQHCEALSSRTESLTERSQFRNWPSSELHALAIESRIKMSSWLTSQVHFRTKWPLFAAWFSTKSTAHSYEAQKKSFYLMWDNSISQATILICFDTKIFFHRVLV